VELLSLTPKGPTVPPGDNSDFGHVPKIWKKILKIKNKKY